MPSTYQKLMLPSNDPKFDQRTQMSSSNAYYSKVDADTNENSEKVRKNSPCYLDDDSHNMLRLKSNDEKVIARLEQPYKIENKKSGSNLSVRSANNIFNEIQLYDKQINNSPSQLAPLIYFNQSKNEAEYMINDAVYNKIKNIERQYYKPSEYMLVTLPKIKEDGDKVIYYGDDNYSGQKIVLESVVIQSTKKLEEENKKRKPFVWDNYELYRKLQTSAKSKINASLNFFEVFRVYLSKSLSGKLNVATIYKGAAGFSVFFVLQLLINRKLRRYSLSLVHFLVFMATSVLSTYSVMKLMDRFFLNPNQCLPPAPKEAEQTQSPAIIGDQIKFTKEIKN